MGKDLFTFKNFRIKQDKCAMKVGTDSVILGSWANTTNTMKILDIGTGTGILALMLAQRSTAHIDAIEIDPDSAKQAMENIGASQYSDRISVMNVSFQQYITEKSIKYDLIITNPPYFNQSLKSDNIKRSLARHTDVLSFEDLISGVKRLLKEEGKFALILPRKEAEIFESMAAREGLFLFHELNIKSDPKRADIIRKIMVFALHSDNLQKEELNIREMDGVTFSSKYKALTKDFYLNF